VRTVTFAAPWLLLALLAAPLALVAALWVERRRSRYAVTFTNLDLLASVLDRKTSLRRWVPLALFVLALAVASVALARPRASVALPAQRATIVLLVDVSGSMRATDVKPSRLGAAQVAMTTFLNRVPSSDKVGLVSFSSEPDILVEPTTDRDIMRQGLQLLYPDAGTAIGDGIATATQVAEQSVAGAQRGHDGKLPAAIILLSDGAQTRGILLPLEGAARAHKAGIRIYTIALGTKHGTLDLGNGLGGNFGFSGQRIAVVPDPAILKAIAEATGGRAYTASSAAEAQRAYRTLGTSLTTRPGKREVSSWFAGAAAALLLGSLGASLLTTGRLP
jgi:Ca-activated chloride channel family protein